MTIISLIYNSRSQNVPLHRYQRWLDDINLKSGRNEGNSEVTIAVIDTAIKNDHPDLLKANITNIPVNGLELYSKNDLEYEHGTIIAGIIAAYPNSEDGVLGINPNARVLSCVFSQSNLDTVDNLVKCIYAAIREKPDIINISLGTSSDSNELHQAIKEAASQKIILVAAAGDNNDFIQYPAQYDEVISVGSIFKEGEFVVEGDNALAIDVFAPGKNVVTTSFSNGKFDYVSADGSSISTAIVTGIISLAKQYNKDITTSMLKEYFETNKIINAQNLISYFTAN